MDEVSFKASVLTRKETIFEGEVVSVSSENDTGKFDILSNHANFITLIKNKLTLHPTGEKAFDLKVSKGVLRVFNNEVKVFLGV